MPQANAKWCLLEEKRRNKKEKLLLLNLPKKPIDLQVASIQSITELHCLEIEFKEKKRRKKKKSLLIEAVVYHFGSYKH